MIIKKVYEKILKDPQIVGAYETIRQNESVNPKAMGTHDMTHITRVTENAVKVATLIGLAEHEIYEIKIAALLHDIGCVYGREGHALRGAEWVGEYFEREGIDKVIGAEAVERITFAIANHGKGADDLGALVLTLADKMDVVAERLTPRAHDVVGTRQYLNIIGHDVRFASGIESEFILDFKTNGKLDREEMMTWYFTPKIFSAVRGMAEFIGRTPKILIDGVEWVKRR